LKAFADVSNRYKIHVQSSSQPFGSKANQLVQPSTYARHHRTHTNEKPYACPMPCCDQR
jgi:hypothetical protein